MLESIYPLNPQNNNIMLTQRYQCTQDVLQQALHGEIILVNLKNNRYFTLNPIATRIWQLLEQYEPSKILEILLLEYDVDAAILQADIEELISQLIKTDLISILK